jgi:tRNAThr (cytosine32-N3)-methyltransferase
MKKNRYLQENFYVRGDGTRVYFFDPEQLTQMWSQWTPEGGIQVDLENPKAESNGCFEVVHLGADRRLIVNRASKVKMYRCWLQGNFRKLETPVTEKKDAEA